MRGLGILTDPYTESSPFMVGGEVPVWRIDANPIKIGANEYGVRDGDSPNESFTYNEAGATRNFDVAWGLRGQAEFQILGFAIRVGPFGGKYYLRRYLPEYHPQYYSGIDGEFRPALIATKVGAIKGVAPRGFIDVPVGDGSGSGDGSGDFHVPDESWNNNGSGDMIPTKRVAIYQYARIPVTYEFVHYDIYSDNPADGVTDNQEFYRFVIKDLKPSAEYLAVPPSMPGICINGSGSGSGSGAGSSDAAILKWSENDCPGRIKQGFPGNIGFIIGTIDYKWTWLQIPYNALPLEAIKNTVGRVNNAEFDGCPPGTLLMMPPDIRRKGSAYGTRTWEIEYTARFNPRGHNKFYDFVGGGFYQASKDGLFYNYGLGAGIGGVTDNGIPPDGKLLYDSRDFMEVFRPGTYP